MGLHEQPRPPRRETQQRAGFCYGGGGGEESADQAGPTRHWARACAGNAEGGDVGLSSQERKGGPRPEIRPRRIVYPLLYSFIF
jgi:hypothetical protein